MPTCMRAFTRAHACVRAKQMLAEQELHEKAMDAIFGATPGGYSKVVLRSTHILVKDASIALIKKFLEIEVVSHFPTRCAAKLVKDVSKSALRKVARYGQVTGAISILHTSFRGSILLHVSVFSVELLHEILRKWRHTREGKYKNSTIQGAGKDVVKKALQNFVRLTVIAGLGSLGAVFGTFFRAGKGTFVGESLGCSAGAAFADTIIASIWA